LKSHFVSHSNKVWVRQTNQLILYKEIISFCTTKKTSTLWAKREFLILKFGYSCTNLHFLKADWRRLFFRVNSANQFSYFMAAVIQMSAISGGLTLPFQTL